MRKPRDEAMRKAPTVACILVLVGTQSIAAPNLVRIGTYDAENGALATVFVDAASVLKTGKHVRAWVTTDFSEFQGGKATDASGNSTAYMSSQQLMLFDCATRDIGYGSWFGFDGRRGSGVLVIKENVAAPTQANSPVRPNSVGNELVTWICKQKR